MYFVCACSMGAVAAPVVREEADFGLPSRKDALQAGLLWRVTHVLHHPLQQLQEKQGGGKEKTRGEVHGWVCVTVILNILHCDMKYSKMFLQ